MIRSNQVENCIDVYGTLKMCDDATTTSFLPSAIFLLFATIFFWGLLLY